MRDNGQDVDSRRHPEVLTRLVPALVSVLVTFTALSASGSDPRPPRPSTQSTATALRYVAGHAEDAQQSWASRAAAFGPDGTRVYSVGGGRSGYGSVGHLVIWDLKGGGRKVVSEGVDCTAVAVSHDGRTLALAVYGPGVRLADAGSGKELRRLGGDRIASRLAGFTEKDASLLTVSGGEVEQWALDGTGPKTPLAKAGDEKVQEAVLSAGGSLLLTADERGHLRLWRTSDWEQVGEARLAAVVVKPLGVCLSADGALACVCASAADDPKAEVTARVIDLKTGRARSTLKGWQPEGGCAGAFLDGGRRLAIGGSLFDTATGELLDGPGPAPAAAAQMPWRWEWAAASPDGREVVACTAGGLVKVWRLSEEQVPRPSRIPPAFTMRSELDVEEVTTFGAFCWSSDSARFYAIGGIFRAGDSTRPARAKPLRLAIFDAKGGKVATADLEGTVPTLAASRDGKVLAVATMPAEPDPKAAGLRLLNPADGSDVRWLERFGSALHSVVGFTADDGLLVLRNQEPRLYDLSTGESKNPITELREAVSTAALNTDGTVLATYGEGRVLRTWRTKDWAKLAEFPVPRHKVSAVAVSPDGNSVYCLWTPLFSRDGHALVDMAHGQERRLPLPDHGTPTIGSFSADGRMLIAYFLFDARTGEQIEAPWRTAIDAMFSPDGSLLAILGQEKLRVWTVGGESPTHPAIR